MKSKSLKLALVIAAALAFNVSELKSTVILFKGQTLENGTKEPVAVQILFGQPNGRKTICKSNASDGKYQQVLTAGKTYYIAFKNYIADTNAIQTPDISKYEEIEKDFFLKPIKKGDVIYEAKIFEPNESVIEDSLADTFQYLEYFLNLNPGTKLKFVFSSYDSWLKGKRIKVEKTNSKGKKYYRRRWFSAKKRLGMLLDDRIEAFKQYLKSKRIYLKDAEFDKDVRVVSPRRKRERRKVNGKNEWFTPKYPNVKVIVK